MATQPPSTAEFFGSGPLRTRFAPSPTGFLHLGHVVNMIEVLGMAWTRGAEVVLRIENHDRTRCKPEYETALLDDLERLGLVPDLGSLAEFRAGESDFRQSNAGTYYEGALKQLQAHGLVYACDCSRKTLAARLLGQQTGELAYDGHCRDRGLEAGPGRALRIRLPDREVRFWDRGKEEQVQHPAQQCGDLVARDRNGNWSYQFAVVVDDLRQGINLIVRGQDILASTGRQLLLAELLVGERPDWRYWHHALLVDGQGRKLSKRDFAADIHSRLNQGEIPEAILGEAAWRMGLQPMNMAISLSGIQDALSKR